MTLENVLEANADRLIIRTNSGYVATITPDDVALYFSKESKQGKVGNRTFAGLTDNWQAVDELVQLCFEYFARYNIDGLRAASQRRGLKPRF